MARTSDWEKSWAPSGPHSAEQPPATKQSTRGLEVAPGLLLTLDGLEQRLEVAFAEADRTYRSITSKNTLGRSPIGRVKICSRYPSSSRSTRIPRFCSSLIGTRTLPMRTRSAGSS